jgi:hypothetical protein
MKCRLHGSPLSLVRLLEIFLAATTSVPLMGKDSIKIDPALLTLDAWRCLGEWCTSRVDSREQPTGFGFRSFFRPVYLFLVPSEVGEHCFRANF